MNSSGNFVPTPPGDSAKFLNGAKPPAFTTPAGGGGSVKADGSVPFTADESMGGNKLTNLAAPTGANDAVRKAYADALITNTLQLVQEIIPGANVTDVDFTGLDGDADGAYLLLFTIKNPTGGTLNYFLRPQGSATNMSYQALSAAGAVPSAGGSTDGYMATADSNKQVFGRLYFTAKRENGLNRHGTVQGIRENPELELMGLVWADASTQLTQLTIHSAGAGGIGAGSKFSLFKLPSLAVGSSGSPIIDVAKADARLNFVDATHIRLDRYNGRYIHIANEAVDPGSTGTGLTNAGNLISSTGADVGSAPAVSTRYYCYMSNSKASFGALQIRLSATGPTLDGDGVRYLGASGNAHNWRFVGWVATNSAGQFEKNQINCWVVSYLNPLPWSLIAIPASDSLNPASYAAPNSATFAPINGGVGCRVRWIHNADRVLIYSFEATVKVPAGKTVAFGVAENSGPGFHQEADGVASDGKELINATAADLQESFTTHESPQLYDGELSFLTAMGKGDGSATIYANVAGGNTPLCNATYIRAQVWA